MISELLDKKSKIRSLFEKDKELSIIPCYNDNDYTLNAIISIFNNIDFSKFNNLTELHTKITETINKNEYIKKDSFKKIMNKLLNFLTPVSKSIYIEKSVNKSSNLSKECKFKRTQVVWTPINSK